MWPAYFRPADDVALPRRARRIYRALRGLRPRVIEADGDGACALEYRVKGMDGALARVYRDDLLLVAQALAREELGDVRVENAYVFVNGLGAKVRVDCRVVAESESVSDE